MKYQAIVTDISKNMSLTVNGARVLLQRAVMVLKWARMQVKPPKSRSCVVKSGRCMDVQPYEVNGETIKSVQQKPVKMLGRWIDGVLSDRNARGELEEKFNKGIKDMDKALVTGTMKVWIYQHLFIQRLGWMIMIYEISVSWIEKLETKASKFLRKWLEVSCNMSSVALYCKDSVCPLPISSLVGEFKRRKAGALVQLQQSPDTTVSDNVPGLSTGRKWLVESEVEVAKSRLRLSEIVGKVQKGKCGVGYSSDAKLPKGPPRQQERKAITDKIGKAEDERMFVRAVQQGIQGQWTRWQNVMKRDLSWNVILKSSPRLISFGLGVTFDTLGSPKNLKRWGLSSDDKCPLCNAGGCGTVSYTHLTLPTKAKV